MDRPTALGGKIGVVGGNLHLPNPVGGQCERRGSLNANGKGFALPHHPHVHLSDVGDHEGNFVGFLGDDATLR